MFLDLSLDVWCFTDTNVDTNRGLTTMEGMVSAWYTMAVAECFECLVRSVKKEKHLGRRWSFGRVFGEGVNALMGDFTKILYHDGVLVIWIVYVLLTTTCRLILLQNYDYASHYESAHLFVWFRFSIYGPRRSRCGDVRWSKLGLTCSPSDRDIQLCSSNAGQQLCQVLSYL